MQTFYVWILVLAAAAGLPLAASTYGVEQVNTAAPIVFPAVVRQPVRAAGLASDQATVMSESAGPVPVYRINCGGNAFADDNGTWTNDWQTYFSVGQEYNGLWNSPNAVIPDVAPVYQNLYDTEIWNNPVIEGRFVVDTARTYTVVLHFAETYFKAPGMRVHNIAIQKQVVLRSLDTFVVAGDAFKALALNFPGIAAPTGVITVSLQPMIENPHLNGIEIYAQQPPSTPPTTPPPVPAYGPPIAVPTPTPPLTSAGGFVTTQGTKFQVNGRLFSFAGTNNAWLLDTAQYSADNIRTLFASHARLGITVVRVFAFLDGFGTTFPTPYPLQTAIGQYNETVLRHLDLILAEAGKNGIRLILPFVNFEPEFGGMQWYVDQLLGPSQPKELFYTDPRVKVAFRAYVTMLVTRVNTITGVAYKDDTTIFAWEAANEPHTTDSYELNRGLPPGAIVRAWLDEISTLVKTLDPNHLFATGEEGYKVDGDTSCCHNSWINSGLKGVDFSGNIRLPHVDFATIHLYPDNIGVAAYEHEWVVPNIVQDRARIAHAAGKPIIMEEYGGPSGYLPTKNELVKFLNDAAFAADYAGTMVWAMWPWPTNDRVTFSYTDDGAGAVLDAARQFSQRTS